MKNIIPVFFTIDNGYAPFLSVALQSAIKNSSKENTYRAIILHEDLTDKNISRISSLATDNFQVEFVQMKEGLESITDRMSNRLRCDYFTLTIYFRLFIPAMFPQYDKGIYIDSDVVITGDLAELFNIDLGDNFIGACADKSVVEVEPLAQYMEQAVGVDRHSYINSGVLLMNLKKLREAELDTHFLSLLNTYHFDCIAPDQDYLNAMCYGRIHYLSDVWDAMPTEDKPEIEDVKIIHYNLFSKPWCYDGVQYGDVFWEYAEDSVYLEEIKAYKENYSDEQKESDSKCLGLLVERGSEIAKSKVTFRRVFESGEKVRL
ncbi:MAG: glycosyltransferase family 8 protein [Ruminococcaceae bacterium]|nr:glycosyltransferase family 8 protein [Oscillospiraceae bacterium]